MKTRLAALLAVLVSGPVYGYTVSEMMGFDMESAIEFNSTTGTPSWVAGRTGKAIVFDATEGITLDTENVETDGSTYNLYGFGFYTGDATHTNVYEIFCSIASGGQQSWCLNVLTSGKLSLEDEAGSSAGCDSTVTLSDNTWYFVEIFIRYHNSLGQAEMFVDGSSQCTTTSQDFLDAINPPSFVRARLSGVGVTFTARFDDMYIFHDVTSASDRCSVSSTRLCEIHAFSGGPASATPDSGDALQAGQWSNISEFPFNATNSAEYQNSGPLTGDVTFDDTGPVCTGGPSGCAAFDGTSVAAQWFWLAARGNGGNTDHFGRYGDGTNSSTADLGLTSDFLLYNARSTAAADVPSGSEYCSGGMYIDGARDFKVQEQWCYVLHLEPAAAAGAGRRLVISG